MGKMLPRVVHGTHTTWANWITQFLWHNLLIRMQMLSRVLFKSRSFLERNVFLGAFCSDSAVLGLFNSFYCWQPSPLSLVPQISSSLRTKMPTHIEWRPGSSILFLLCVFWRPGFFSWNSSHPKLNKYLYLSTSQALIISMKKKPDTWF